MAVMSTSGQTGSGSTELDDDWVERSIAIAADLDVRLSDPRVLNPLAERIAEIARRHDASVIVGVSPTGERLASAAREASDPSLNGAATVIVEGYLVTGVQLVRAARVARAGGAREVVAIAVAANPTGWTSAEDELGIPVLVLWEDSGMGAVADEGRLAAYSPR